MSIDNQTCHQFYTKNKYKEQDLLEFKISEGKRDMLTIKALEFRHLESEIYYSLVREFIVKYEYLGKMPSRPTHLFGAFFKNRLVGALVMATPNSFSYVLGKENFHLEKLIARGATNSIAPKNTASWLIMRSINWMIANTHFRMFTAYSDPQANEFGTVYQSCNFIYLGNHFGARHLFFDPQNPEKGWFSSREFRKLGSYKRYAKDKGIAWHESWNHNTRVLWSHIPREIENVLRKGAKEYEARCIKKKIPPKHKYIYLKGRSKRETELLLHKMKAHNPRLKTEANKNASKYPKRRVSSGF